MRKTLATLLLCLTALLGNAGQLNRNILGITMGQTNEANLKKTIGGRAKKAPKFLNLQWDSVDFVIGKDQEFVTQSTFTKSVRDDDAVDAFYNKAKSNMLATYGGFQTIEGPQGTSFTVSDGAMAITLMKGSNRGKGTVLLSFVVKGTDPIDREINGVTLEKDTKSDVKKIMQGQGLQENFIFRGRANSNNLVLDNAKAIGREWDYSAFSFNTKGVVYEIDFCKGFETRAEAQAYTRKVIADLNKKFIAWLADDTENDPYYYVYYDMKTALEVSIREYKKTEAAEVEYDVHVVYADVEESKAMQGRKRR